MEGTEKQVKWANDIIDKAVKETEHSFEEGLKECIALKEYVLSSFCHCPEKEMEEYDTNIQANRNNLRIQVAVLNLMREFPARYIIDLRHKLNREFPVEKLLWEMKIKIHSCKYLSETGEEVCFKTRIKENISDDAVNTISEFFASNIKSALDAQ